MKDIIFLFKCSNLLNFKGLREGVILNFIDKLTGLTDTFDGFLYSNILFWVLIFVGLYFTIRTGFVQIRMFPEGLKVLTEKSHEGGISSFQALMIATASRVGTGNIAGVATAIVMGGPGAVFWMWLMAIVGGSSAFIESTLAQIYKEPDGEIYKGGPAYYIEKALKARWLGIIFAIFLILTFAFGFNGLQAYNIASAFEHYSGDHYSTVAMGVGALLAAIAAFLFFGGAHMISKWSSVLVPVMASIYIFVGLVIFFVNIEKVPGIFADIFREAFDFQKISAGFAGSCVVWGVKRGLFSNEAGMGSAPNAAAAADVSHPVKQGLVQVISVFIDTLLICSTTIFIILCTGKFEVGGELNGIPLVQASVKTVFGEAGVALLTFSVALFALTSLIGNYFYAEFNFRFITESKGWLAAFRILAVIAVFVGANSSLPLAWNTADILMGFMALINCFAIILLGKYAIAAMKDYSAQKAQGKDPIFKASSIGLDNTDVWK